MKKENNVKNNVQGKEESYDAALARFNKVGNILAICCVLLLLMGCFYNGFMMIANCKELTFDLSISIFMSLILCFMGSFGLGYYFSFKALGNAKKTDKK